ncbi:MAG: site-specific integrase [Chitinophagales bacterium]|nr:site-specific integrase [Chitinophagales bacterium]
MSVNSFINYLKYEKRYSDKTILSYQTDIEQFQVFLKDNDLAFRDVNTRFMRAWVVGLHEDYTAASINRKISAIKSLYKFLLKTNEVESNPAKLIPSLKTPNKNPVFVEEKDLASMFHKLPKPDNFETARDLLILELLYNTGMRRAELIGLKDNDIDKICRNP